MTKAEHISPTLNATAFNCPSCNAYAHQDWFYMAGSLNQTANSVPPYSDYRYRISKCKHCGNPGIWLGNKLLYPMHIIAEPASNDLPPDVKADFEEARTIANMSPRGAAALLRLAIQKLCIYLGQSGTNINADIKALVTAGLPAKVQQALDSVRVIGNEAVHPGSLDLKDDAETVHKLFRLVNFIVQKTITEPKEIEDIYGGLPSDKLSQIVERDKKKA